MRIKSKFPLFRGLFLLISEKKNRIMILMIILGVIHAVITIFIETRFFLPFFTRFISLDNSLADYQSDGGTKGFCFSDDSFENGSLRKDRAESRCRIFCPLQERIFNGSYDAVSQWLCRCGCRLLKGPSSPPRCC